MEVIPQKHSAMLRVMAVPVPYRMTVDEFLAWSVRQDKGRDELQDGLIIMQQSQTCGHIELKARIFTAFLAAMERAGIPFHAAPDGATVSIDAYTWHEPDALVVEKREIVWHRRAEGGGLAPPLAVREGTLRLDPPGIEMAIEEVFGTA